MSYTKGQEIFSWKGQIVNILGFVRHKICHSNSTLPLWYKTSHRQYINEWAQLCFKKTLLTLVGSGL